MNRHGDGSYNIIGLEGCGVRVRFRVILRFPSPYLCRLPLWREGHGFRRE